DAATNALATAFTTGQAYTVSKSTGTGPALSSVVMDDGTDLAIGVVADGQQHSSIRRITLNLDSALSAATGSSSASNSSVSLGGLTIQVARQDGGTFTVTVNHTISNNKSKLVLTFSGGANASLIEGDSLADGNYTLSVAGLGSGSYSQDFYRLFGDVNGDR